MILVLLGTQSNNFLRLIKAVEENIKNGIIKDQVVVQSGHTKYESKNMEIIQMMSQEELEEKIKKAKIVITHGGVGSILTCIKLGKKVIAVPRLKKYKEHVNDHQLQIVNSFEELGYIKKVINIEELSEQIKNVRNFIPKKYISNTHNIIEIIEKYINEN